MYLGLITVVVQEYDPAISFFLNALGFELIEDTPSATNDGRPKRWVVVRPPGAATGLLLARAGGQDQIAVTGRHWSQGPVRRSVGLCQRPVRNLSRSQA
jgi:catechol 2,3-dioxygenase-like lactoylglutathione lyase family enzyme